MSGETLPEFIDRHNRQWVEAHRRISRELLTGMLELTGAQIAELWRDVDPYGPSLGVSWAGVDPSPLWLDRARDFTEYWTHRQQIRHATGQDTDPDPRSLALVLDTFMRALPYTLRGTPAPIGTQVQVVVEGPAGGTWTATALQAQAQPQPQAYARCQWSLAADPSGAPAATIHFDPETAWLLCTRGIEPAAAIARSRLDGDRRFGEAVCRIVSIIYNPA